MVTGLFLALGSVDDPDKKSLDQLDSGGFNGVFRLVVLYVVASEFGAPPVAVSILLGGS